MRKKLLGFVFVGALLLGAALPGTALAGPPVGGVHVGPHGNKDVQVEICHKGETINVNGNAVAKHLAHGDSLDAC